MVKDKRCLIAVDLDNTILSNCFSFDTESINALIYAKSLGHVVMIASARPSCMALPYYNIIKPDSLICILNGAYVYHPNCADYQMRSYLMSRNIVSRLIDVMNKTSISSCWIENDNDIISTPLPPFNLPYFKEVFRQSNVQFVSSPPMLPTAQFTIIAKSANQRDEVVSALSSLNGISVEYHSDPIGVWHISIVSDKANKWNAVQLAAKHYNILPDNIFTFGDELNDLNMIIHAANGFAMCNGNERVKAAAIASGASITSFPCGKGGVAKELQRFNFFRQTRTVCCENKKIVNI